MLNKKSDPKAEQQAIEAEYSYGWLTPENVQDKDIEEFISMMNEVAVRERNMGFSQPIRGSEVEEFGGVIRRELETGAHILAIRHKGRLVGSATLIQCGLPARRHVGEVKRGIISREYRGKNLLINGWEMIVNRCKDVGVEVAVIDVRTDYPRTLRLWKQVGFREFGRLPCYAKMDGKYIDGIYLYYTISEYTRNIRARDK